MNKIYNKRKISDVVQTSNSGDFLLPLISEYLNTTISIIDVRLSHSRYGLYAVITFEDGNQCRSSNEVVLAKLKLLVPELDGETAFLAVPFIPPGKRYIDLRDPANNTERPRREADL